MEETLFTAALAMSDPAERSAYLARACGEDAALRARVEALLRSHEEAGPFLQRPAVEEVAGPAQATVDSPADPSPDEQSALAPHTRIGPYKLLLSIGEGGMGTVWLAEQTEPVRRTVALKIIKPGMDSAQVIARFEAERQALALMDHPNIARVVDAGTTAGEPGGVSPGRPYFVMELVKGLPITRYCDQEHLTLRERLELFLGVCAAVQHAHQKGIIHRDLKPSNVLVALVDGKPVPKVIDFGIAKATGQRLTERTLFTEVGAIVGTLEYMAPEQAELNNLDVDTRADVYSLGVLLYELLTGAPPFTGKELRSAAFTEMLRMIREVEPAKPSTKLSSSPDLPAVAARRKLEPKKLTRLVRGELDWIVMKALEKDRGRRYETANGFAQDVQRYLKDEPVEASPPSRRYRLGKFARKHRKALTLTVAFVLLLVAGVAVSTWQAVRAAQAQRRARQTEAVTRAVGDFLLHDLLDQADPDKQADRNFEPDPDIKLRTALDRAAARIGERFTGEPLVEAAIRHTIGKAYCGLGQYAAAQAQLERAVELHRQVQGEEDPETVAMTNSLAEAYQGQGKYARAEALYSRVLARRRRLRGPEHPSTLIALGNLAGVYKDQEKYAEAESLYSDALEVARRVHGEGSSQVAALMNNLAVLYSHQGKHHQAEALYRKVLELRPADVVVRYNIASAYLAQGKLAQAEPLLSDALETYRRTRGPGHPDTVKVMQNLATCYLLREKYAQAEPLYAGVLEARRRDQGPEHPGTLKAMRFLAVVYENQGRYDRSTPLRAQVVGVLRRKLPPDDPKLAEAIQKLAVNYMQRRKPALAEPLLRESLQIREQQQPDHWETFAEKARLGECLLRQKKYAEAEPALLAGYKGLKALAKALPAARRDLLRRNLEQIVELYDAWDRKGQAAQWRTKLKLGAARPAP